MPRFCCLIKPSRSPLNYRFASSSSVTIIMATKSVAREAEEILLATEMIRLGARLQVLQAETSLSYDRLARLYREVKECSPPKGMLPFSDRKSVVAGKSVSESVAIGGRRT